VGGDGVGLVHPGHAGEGISGGGGDGGGGEGGERSNAVTVTDGAWDETTGTERADESVAGVWLLSVLMTMVAMPSEGAMICASTSKLAALIDSEMSEGVSPSPMRFARFRLYAFWSNVSIVPATVATKETTGR
jgi:hypothetical protein